MSAKTEINSDFWLARWKSGKIGWHQTEVEPALIAWAKELAPASRIFVPLCGKSLDLKWCADQGHAVVGAELSEEACSQFFSDHGLEPKITATAPFKRFEAGNITIFQGDFFALSPELLGTIDAVYDRAALIAMPPGLRAQYTRQLRRLISPHGQNAAFSMLQIILTRTPHDETGPPFSIPVAELSEHYAGTFSVSQISAEPVEANGPEGSSTVESVFKLTLKH